MITIIPNTNIHLCTVLYFKVEDVFQFTPIIGWIIESENNHIFESPVSPSDSHDTDSDGVIIYDKSNEQWWIPCDRSGQGLDELRRYLVDENCPM